MSSSSSYAAIASEKESVIKENEKDESIKKLYESGWTIIRKNKSTTRTEILNLNTNRNKDLKKKAIEKLEEKYFKTETNKMIDNWNNFRDTENELRGDTSLYINYKNEIEDMLKEDEYIAEQLYDLNQKSEFSDDADYSDEENNKHLMY